jgi:acylphosphatase
MKTAHITISGKVWGVGFRYFAVQRAREHNIYGTVSNKQTKINEDDRKEVEIFCQGEDKNLDKFILEIKKGPSRSVITKFNIELVDRDKFVDFRIVY